MMKEPGLDDRHRNEDGQIDRKHGNTKIDSLRETYGGNFGGNHRGDMELENLLKQENVDSLSQLLKKHPEWRRK